MTDRTGDPVDSHPDRLVRLPVEAGAVRKPGDATSRRPPIRTIDRWGIQLVNHQLAVRTVRKRPATERGLRIA
jgi:hypothetical protein